MFESRRFPQTRKPRIVLDKKFAMAKDLDIGEKGQMRANLVLDSERLEMEEGSEHKVMTFLVVTAEDIQIKEKR